MTPADLAQRLYEALAAGDRAGVASLLAPGFVAEFSPGYGPPVAGRHVGTDAIDHGWWELGRRWAVRAEPAEFIPTVDGRLLVVGRYRGRSRGDPNREPFGAPFAHLWTGDGDRLMHLVQITDTGVWHSPTQA